MTDEPKIVEAAGTISLSTPGVSLGGKPLSKLIEEAMAKAIMDCHAEGILDPEVHKARMQEARNRVKTEFYSKLGTTLS
jgi:hypothetical protein